MTVWVALCTCPDEDTALRVAESLVARRVAACVNVVPRVVSVYQWQGKIERDGEVLLIIKTTERAFPALKDAILTAHPYELPEIIAVPVESGLADYLAWVESETRESSLK